MKKRNDKNYIRELLIDNYGLTMRLDGRNNELKQMSEHLKLTTELMQIYKNALRKYEDLSYLDPPKTRDGELFDSLVNYEKNFQN